jgi:hypothetical protein
MGYDLASICVACRTPRRTRSLIFPSPRPRRRRPSSSVEYRGGFSRMEEE